MKKIDWEILEADNVNRTVVVRFSMGDHEHTPLNIPIKDAANLKREIERYIPVKFFDRIEKNIEEASLTDLIGFKGQTEKNIDELAIEVKFVTAVPVVDGEIIVS